MQLQVQSNIYVDCRTMTIFRHHELATSFLFQKTVVSCAFHLSCYLYLSLAYNVKNALNCKYFRCIFSHSYCQSQIDISSIHVFVYMIMQYTKSLHCSICVCVCLCVSIHTHTLTYIYIYSYINVYVWMCIYVCMLLNLYARK